jgi:hypothetical protein
LYFQGPDRWTANPVEALDFKAIDRALNFIRTWKLKDMEIAFSFKGKREVHKVPMERIGLSYSES